MAYIANSMPSLSSEKGEIQEGWSDTGGIKGAPPGWFAGGAEDLWTIDSGLLNEGGSFSCEGVKNNGD